MTLALGSARGIAYLHNEANPRILHGEIKSSNILLDDKLMARVADFELSKFVLDGDNLEHVSTHVIGTVVCVVSFPCFSWTIQCEKSHTQYTFVLCMLHAFSSLLIYIFPHMYLLLTLFMDVQ